MLFQCNGCLKTYRRKNTLKRHWKFECGKEPQFSCPYCPFKAKHKHNYKQHLIMRHSDVCKMTTPIVRIGFRCPNCPRTYKNKNHLSRHLWHECGKEPRFSCEFCSYRSKHKHTYKAHLICKHKVSSQEELYRLLNQSSMREQSDEVPLTSLGFRQNQWYLNDLATVAGTSNIKLIEGIVIAVETLCGEIIFFALAGKIIKKLGYANTLTLCFAIYSVRFVLLASIDNPWWAVPIEAVLQGPTYALLYSTVVEYASAISPPGTSATTQGIVAGMDDGLGFAVGNLIAGLIYSSFGGRVMYYCYCGFSLFCGLLHFIIHRFVFTLKLEDHVETSPKHQPRSPEELSLMKKLEQGENRPTVVRRIIPASAGDGKDLEE